MRLANHDSSVLILQFLKFSLVGTIGFLVDVGVLYAILAATDFGLLVGRLFSFLAAATMTWTLNRRYTFPGRHDGSVKSQWGRFVAVNALGGLINYGVYALLILSEDLFETMPFLAVAAGSLSGLGFNFSASRFLVFRQRA